MMEEEEEEEEEDEWWQQQFIQMFTDFSLVKIGYY